MSREFRVDEFKDGILRWVRYKREYRLNSPKSKYAKFERSLCNKCNNEKSQPFDLDYDRFISYYKENEDEIFKHRGLNFQDVFGIHWEESVENLKKYYVKHIGCRLAQSEFEILPDMIDYLNDKSELLSIKFNFYLRHDINDFLNFVKSREGKEVGYLGLDEIAGNYSPSTKSWYDLYSGYVYRGLVLHYYYSNEENGMKSNLDFAPSIELPIFRNKLYDEHMKEEYGR